jgi:hypothetical protein
MISGSAVLTPLNINLQTLSELHQWYSQSEQGILRVYSAGAGAGMWLLSRDKWIDNADTRNRRTLMHSDEARPNEEWTQSQRLYLYECTSRRRPSLPCTLSEILNKPIITLDGTFQLWCGRTEADCWLVNGKVMFLHATEFVKCSARLN